MRLLLTLLLLRVVLITSAAVFVYTGIFEISADVPHSTIVFRVMETVRNRAITVRAVGIDVPPLSEPEKISKGALDYSEMCIQCHLAPGEKESELRQGLYPQPPDLTERVQISQAEMFWVIKHGIKMTGMPAWGLTHDDERIWNIVAFIQELPGLTPARYRELVRAAANTGHDRDGTTDAASSAPE